jgi:hypothetical protein
MQANRNLVLSVLLIREHSLIFGVVIPDGALDGVEQSCRCLIPPECLEGPRDLTTDCLHADIHPRPELPHFQSAPTYCVWHQVGSRAGKQIGDPCGSVLPRTSFLNPVHEMVLSFVADSRPCAEVHV